MVHKSRNVPVCPVCGVERPLAGITVYHSDIVTHRLPCRCQNQAPSQGAKRGKVYEFSKRSRLRLAFVAANVKPGLFKSMITLTYPSDFPAHGTRCKAHLAALLQWLRDNELARHYLWFLEFQARGAPHFHIMVDGRASAKRRSMLSAQWYRVVGSEDQRHLRAGTNWRNARDDEPVGLQKYAVKYAQKAQQKNVPEGFQDCGRFWGTSRGLPGLDETQTYICDDAKLDELLSDWEYLETARTCKVLYNAAKAMRRPSGFKQLSLLEIIQPLEPDAGREALALHLAKEGGD